MFSTIIGVLAEKLGPLAILAWYLYYHESVRMPARDKQLMEMQETWKVEFARERETHQTETQGHIALVTKVIEHCPRFQEDARNDREAKG